MRFSFTALLDVFFPLRDGARVVATLDKNRLGELYQPQRIGDVNALLPFDHPAVRACILEAKFHQNQRAIEFLGAILAIHIQSIPGDSIIVPIPLSPERLRTRGFNQVTLIAEAAMRPTERIIEPNALRRTRDTAPQTSLSRAERLKNMQDAFAITDDATIRAALAERPIVLLDDVTTTGATLAAARAALAPHTTNVTCLALAH